MLGYLRTGLAPGLLDPHVEAFERIRLAYRWTPDEHVASHNDPNPGNILFDGERLWLVDWETAHHNDPLTDLAIVAQSYAPTPELEDALLRAWRGAPTDRVLRARLLLMRQMTRLWYAGILLAPAVQQGMAITGLAAPSAEEFRAMTQSGHLPAGSRESRLALGKMLLAGFLAGAAQADFEEALTVSRDS
jgi:Ser/Thr protein kinase RdoA (MazF antagonist)